MHWPQFAAYTSEGLLDLFLISNIGGPENATLGRCAKSHTDLFQRRGVARQRHDSVTFLGEGFYKTRTDAWSDAGNNCDFIVRHVQSSCLSFLERGPRWATLHLPNWIATVLTVLFLSSSPFL